MIRSHFADEEPDVDEDLEWLADAEDRLRLAGHCGRCGLAGHQDKRCPTVNLTTLKVA